MIRLFKSSYFIEMLIELLRRTRSYRRFDENHQIPIETLESLIELTRFSPSARNAQPLKYLLCNDKNLNERLFPHLKWAGYLTDWDGPSEGERPSAYIVMFQDTTIGDNIFCDDGIALQTIMLGATELHLGGCIIGAFNKSKIQEILQTPSHLKPLYLIALGKPIEDVVIDEIENNDFQYWRDENRTHHVPKRSTEELIWQLKS